MKFIFLFLAISVFMISSCDEDESQEEVRSTSFSIFLRHLEGDCNNTSLNFTFFLEHSSLGIQETFTLAPGDFIVASTLPFNDGDFLNVQIFAASSENPLHEANIPMIFNNYTDAQLSSLNNELTISYCHQEDTGNITWVFDI